MLPHLFIDLQHRLAQLDRDLSQQIPQLPQYAADYAETLVERVRRWHGLVVTQLADPTLSDPALARYHYTTYRRGAEFADITESGPALVLTRFGDGERYLTELVHRVCREIGYPHRAPLCAAMSTQYYWVIPDMDLILAPRTEVESLLALPDLYHEVGHILAARHETKLLEPLRLVIDSYFDQEIAEARRRGWDPKSIDEIEEQRRAWQREWVIEVCCDLIATYCCGLPYGLANTRLAATGPNPFTASESHPPDDTRARAIEAMLRAMGEAAAAQASAERWQAVLHLGTSCAPATYELCFGDRLLQGLIETLLKSLAAMKLVPFTQRAVGANTVASWIGAAWTQFLSDPKGYAVWQRARMVEVRAIVAL